jgi:hypothetical protein
MKRYEVIWFFMFTMFSINYVSSMNKPPSPHLGDELMYIERNLPIDLHAIIHDYLNSSGYFFADGWKWLKQQMPNFTLPQIFTNFTLPQTLLITYLLRSYNCARSGLPLPKNSAAHRIYITLPDALQNFIQRCHRSFGPFHTCTHPTVCNTHLSAFRANTAIKRYLNLLTLPRPLDINDRGNILTLQKGYLNSQYLLSVQSALHETPLLLTKKELRHHSSLVAALWCTHGHIATLLYWDYTMRPHDRTSNENMPLVLKTIIFDPVSYQRMIDGSAPLPEYQYHQLQNSFAPQFQQGHMPLATYYEQEKTLIIQNTAGEQTWPGNWQIKFMPNNELSIESYLNLVRRELSDRKSDIISSHTLSNTPTKYQSSISKSGIIKKSYSNTTEILPVSSLPFAQYFPILWSQRQLYILTPTYLPDRKIVQWTRYRLIQPPPSAPLHAPLKSSPPSVDDDTHDEKQRKNNKRYEFFLNKPFRKKE